MVLMDLLTGMGSGLRFGEAKYQTQYHKCSSYIGTLLQNCYIKVASKSRVIAL